MDLKFFREIVDRTPAGLAGGADNLERLYAYAGLDSTGGMRRAEVTEALRRRISAAFPLDRDTIWRACRAMKVDLIREHVLEGAPLDPYFEVLDNLQSGVRMEGEEAAGVSVDWEAGVAAARDYGAISGYRMIEPERHYVREFAVARAARVLRDAGYAIKLAPGWISMDEAGEAKLVSDLEALIVRMGGLNIARRIFRAISPLYDPVQQRYHLAPRTSFGGDGAPQAPWGYLLQLAVKHLDGQKPHQNTEANWRRLTGLATAFAAVIDVQPYHPPIFGIAGAGGVIPFLQELAVYDSLFTLSQLRPSDVERLARGMFDFLDPLQPTTGGWSIDQALQVVGYLLDPARDQRGPMVVSEADICRALPAIPKGMVHHLLEEVFSHGAREANRGFSHPTDAPTAQDSALGQTFFAKPLLRLSGRRHVLIDRSVCAPACLEALLTALRPMDKQLDNHVGLAVERFLAREFQARGVSVASGEYRHLNKENGECDLVVGAPETLLFFELKKKALTRRAKIGSDADLLRDLAESLLDAHVQAGWHEVRIQAAGHLDLRRHGVVERVDLAGRDVEKIAVSMLDFGRFQDRVNLAHFLEAAMKSSFTPHDATLAKKFDRINASLQAVRDQLALKYPDGGPADQPFFNCWFLSVPQILILLDDVTDAASLRGALWASRFMTTGSSDFYHERAYAKRLRGDVPAAE